MATATVDGLPLSAPLASKDAASSKGSASPSAGAGMLARTFIGRPPAAVYELLGGRAVTLNGLREAVSEAELRRAQIARVLHDAGQRGQQLLAEGVSLERRLEDARAELARPRSRPRTSGDEGCCRGPCPGVDSTSSCEFGARRASSRSSSCASEDGEKAASSSQLLALDNLKQHTEKLHEELQDKEAELVCMTTVLLSDTPASSDPQALAEEAGAEELRAEISRLEASAERAAEVRALELAALQDELQEATQRQEDITGRVERTLEDMRERNAALQVEVNEKRSENQKAVSRLVLSVELLRHDVTQLRNGVAEKPSDNLDFVQASVRSAAKPLARTAPAAVPEAASRAPSLAQPLAQEPLAQESLAVARGLGESDLLEALPEDSPLLAQNFEEKVATPSLAGQSAEGCEISSKHSRLSTSTLATTSVGDETERSSRGSSRSSLAAASLRARRRSSNMHSFSKHLPGAVGPTGAAAGGEEKSVTSKPDESQLSGRESWIDALSAVTAGYF